MTALSHPNECICRICAQGMIDTIRALEAKVAAVSERREEAVRMGNALLRQRDDAEAKLQAAERRADGLEEELIALKGCVATGDQAIEELATATARARRLEEILVMVLPECLVCPDCGPFAKVDAECCCTTCGRDTTRIPTKQALSAEVEGGKGEPA